MLRQIQRLMARFGQHEDFSGYVTALRTAHKPQRNFMKLLDATRWT